MNTLSRRVVLAAALTAAPAAARAQTARPSGAAPAHLPEPTFTRHSVSLPGRTLHFTAEAQAIQVPGPEGAPEAEIATIAYTLDGADPAQRPVMFAFNGGPGFSSAYVQLGGFGPWRIAMDSVPSSPPALLDNAETWLDFADLVFIDAVETGFSRFISTDPAVRKRWLSVSGDVAGFAQVIQLWLDANRRLVSPKYLAGESYSGLRVPRITRVLQSGQGVGVDGMVLISPLLDAGGRSTAFDPLRWVELLPSMTAVQRSAEGDVTEAALADVEAYAAGDFLRDQLVVARNPAALDRVTARVSALTGLDPALVRRMHGQIDARTFLDLRNPERVGSPYDATVTDPKAEEQNPWFPEPDPITARLNAPLSEAMASVYDRLGWHPDRTYRSVDRSVARQWDWQARSPPESVTAMRVALAVDSRLRVLIAHGLYDVITPYFATKLILGALPDIGAPDRVRLMCFPSGHMVYARDATRQALRDAVQSMITAPV